MKTSIRQRARNALAWLKRGDRRLVQYRLYRFFRKPPAWLRSAIKKHPKTIGLMLTLVALAPAGFFVFGGINALTYTTTWLVGFR